MSMSTLLINRKDGDPDIAPSLDRSIAPFENTVAFPSPICVRNSVKRGIPMGYWTCIDIQDHGIYDVDVRHLPGKTEARVRTHAVNVSNPSKQREVALRMIADSFASQQDMRAWLDAQALTADGPVVLLHDWVPVPDTAAPIPTSSGDTTAQTAKAIQAMRRRLDRWELEHLRKHAAVLSDRLSDAQAQIEDLESEVSRAWHCAASWQQNAESLVRDLEAAGKSIGLAQNGALVVADEDDGMPF